MEILFGLVLGALLCVGLFIEGGICLIIGLVTRKKSVAKGDNSKAYRILLIFGVISLILAVIFVFYFYHILK